MRAPLPSQHRLAAGRPGPCLAVALAALAAAPAPASAQAMPRTGVACTTGTSPNPTFTLTARAGYISLPDGNTMYMWGFSEGGQPFQHPGPLLCVTEGDTVTVVLQNPAGPWGATSIIFPGQEGVLADGAPAQPQFSGTTLTSLTAAAPPGGSVTYSFVAARPGEYLCESGTEPWKQVRMGLFGALIVRPAAVPAGGTGAAAEYASRRLDSRFTPGEEFLVLLSELDPFQHQAAERGRPFAMTGYHPRYWLLNGRGFPDSIADNGTPWLPAQPYGALARIHEFNDQVAPTDPAWHPYPGRIHYLNAGTEAYPFHPHGNNGLVIGRDGHPLEGPLGQDLSMEKFAINIGPGQAWDVIFKWYDAERYSTANPVPVTVPSLANMELGQFFGGSPYLGVKQDLPPNVATLNECGEYYIISHNHALFQITSWGMTMSGPITYLRIDPPPGPANTCPPFP